MRSFKSIFEHKPKFAQIDEFSEVKRDESLTVSQILSLHLRGIPANVHIYDDVQYVDNYNDDNEEYYELENDLSDYNAVVPSSFDNYIKRVRNESLTHGSGSGDNNSEVMETLPNQNSATSEREDS